MVIIPLHHPINAFRTAIFYLCVGVSIVASGSMMLALFKHRRAYNQGGSTFQENHGKLEIFWAMVPLLFFIAMAIPASKIFIQIHHHITNQPVTLQAKAGKVSLGASQVPLAEEHP
jgi:heme/copper-type cytochrome/quinol oxidase subunit 2